MVIYVKLFKIVIIKSYFYIKRPTPKIPPLALQFILLCKPGFIPHCATINLNKCITDIPLSVTNTKLIKREMSCGGCPKTALLYLINVNESTIQS